MARLESNNYLIDDLRPPLANSGHWIAYRWEGWRWGGVPCSPPFPQMDEIIPKESPVHIQWAQDEMNDISSLLLGIRCSPMQIEVWTNKSKCGTSTTTWLKLFVLRTDVGIDPNMDRTTAKFWKEGKNGGGNWLRFFTCSFGRRISTMFLDFCPPSPPCCSHKQLHSTRNFAYVIRNKHLEKSWIRKAALFYSNG